MNRKLIPHALRQCKVGTIFYSLLQNDISSIRISKSVTHFECFSLSTIISVLKHICSQKKNRINKQVWSWKRSPVVPHLKAVSPSYHPFVPLSSSLKCFWRRKFLTQWIEISVQLKWMLADYKSSVGIRVESVLTKNSIEVIFFPLKTQVFLICQVCTPLYLTAYKRL